jgi:hypothetical protein
MVSGRGFRLAVWASALVASLAAGATGAQEPHPCAAIAVDAERLACYDRAFGRPNATVPAATATVATATAAAAPAATPADPVKDFGLTPAQQKALDPQRVEDTGPTSVRATIAEVQTQRDGQFVLTLDNGQVWAQNDPAERAYPKPGEVVEIRKAAFGSFLLVRGERGAVRVRRVK